MKTGIANLVYIRDDSYGWLPARITSVDNSSLKASVTITLPTTWDETTCHSNVRDEDEINFNKYLKPRTIDLTNYPDNKLPSQNLDNDGRTVYKSDLADLEFVNEAVLLYNLKKRNSDGMPYTFVRDILVSINPFQWIQGLYSNDTRQYFANKFIWSNDESEIENEVKSDRYPHIYEISSRAYRAITVGANDQCIIITGESGSGKTEAAKLIMSHLAIVHSTRPPSSGLCMEGEAAKRRVQARILDSNELLEAFGNAKTSRNDNSSRFGRFTQLKFDAGRTSKGLTYCVLAGSSCKTFLFEKSRVIAHNVDERSYHVFYQLLAASEGYKRAVWEEGLMNTTPSSFRYLNCSEETSIPGRDDATDWKGTLEGLAEVGFDRKEIKSLIQVLCIVLQLGNIMFATDPANDQRSIITSSSDLKKLSNLLGISTEALTLSMTSRTLTTSHDCFKVPLNISAAVTSVDALAKDIYSRLFYYLTEIINGSTNENDDDGKRIICLLDLFGFESFDNNYFEQFCINYANEVLHHKYIYDNFCSIQKELESEGVSVDNFTSVDDNSEVLDLLHGKMSVIMMLNEESIRPQGNASSFVYKVKAFHKNTDNLIQKKLFNENEFGIRHYAGSVTYDATEFVDKNIDAIPNDLKECISYCQNIIMNEFEKKPHDSNRASRINPSSTVISQFKVQLNDLLDIISPLNTWYICCIKPNPRKQPRVTSHISTLSQLRVAGLLTAAKMSHHVFPNRLSYDEFSKLYSCLTSKDLIVKSNVMSFLSSILPDGRYICGKTRIYFRPGGLEKLYGHRVKYLSLKAIKIQTSFRSFRERRRFKTIATSMVRIQSLFRARVERRSFRRAKSSATSLGNMRRIVLAKRLITRLKRSKAAVRIQTRWRVYVAIKNFQKMKAATRTIQKFYRTTKKWSGFASKLRKCVEQVRVEKRIQTLTKTLLQLSREDGTTEGIRDLLKESARMLNYYRKEVCELRKEVADKNKEIDDLWLKNKKLERGSSCSRELVSVYQMSIDALREENQTAKTEMAAQTKTIESLKKDDFKNKSMDTELQMDSLKRGYEMKLESVKSDRQKLCNQHKLKEEELQKQISIFKRELTAIDEGRTRSIKEYEKKLRTIESDYGESFTRLMEVLDSTRTANEVTKSEKDNQIFRLKSDYEILRKESEVTKDRKDAEILRLNREMIDARLRRSAILTEKDEEISRLLSLVSMRDSEIFLLKEELALQDE